MVGETGTATGGPVATADPERVEHFWDKVQKTSTCWIWTGARDPNGYGNFGLGDRKVGKAHVFSYELHKGEVPDGLEVDHTCRTRACVNPEHLEAVTHAVNNDRRLFNGLSRTHCIRGHEFTPENTAILERPEGGTKRACRACFRLRWHAYGKRQRALRKAVARG